MIYCGVSLVIPRIKTQIFESIFKSLLPFKPTTVFFFMLKLPASFEIRVDYFWNFVFPSPCVNTYMYYHRISTWFHLFWRTFLVESPQYRLHFLFFTRRCTKRSQVWDWNFTPKNNHQWRDGAQLASFVTPQNNHWVAKIHVTIFVFQLFKLDVMNLGLEFAQKGQQNACDEMYEDNARRYSFEFKQRI